MSDVTLQLDEALMARLRAVARTRGCTLEALIAQLLDELLPPAAPDAADDAQQWDPEEAAFLSEAVQAFDAIPAGEKQKTDDGSEWDKPLL